MKWHSLNTNNDNKQKMARLKNGVNFINKYQISVISKSGKSHIEM